MAENEISIDLAKQLLTGINEIKLVLSNKSPMSDWLNWQQAMAFLGYKETSMRALEKEGKLRFKMVGRRKFIKRQDLENFIEQL
jgi:hypothetical protein